MKFTLNEVQNLVMGALQVTIDVCNKNNILYYAQAGTVLGAIRHNGPIPWDYDADIIIPNNIIDKFAECAAKELPEKYYVDYYKTSNKSKRQFPRIGCKGYNTEKIHLDVFRLIGLPDKRDIQEKLLKEAKIYERNIALMRSSSLCRLLAKRHFSQMLGKYGLSNKTINYYINKFDEICRSNPYEYASYVANPSGKYGVKNIFQKDVYGEGCIVEFMDFKIRIPSQYDFYLKQYYGDYMKYPPEEDIQKIYNKTFHVK